MRVRFRPEHISGCFAAQLPVALMDALKIKKVLFGGFD
jgi:hypothetical protein